MKEAWAPRKCGGRAGEQVRGGGGVPVVADIPVESVADVGDRCDTGLVSDAAFLLFGGWAAACIAAALKGRLRLWVALWLPPLGLVSWEWLHPPRDAGFGFHPWGVQALFLALCLVVAATGLLALQSAPKQG